jgi:hypothetical protein
MSVVGAGITVTFKNENWLDTPTDQRVKWVSLDSVVAFRSNGTAKSLLHELTSSRNKYWPQDFLLTNNELAVRILADRTRQFADDILRGDLSSLADIAAYNGQTAT